MHIPDGYLGPQTYATLYAAMAPVWYLASKKVKEVFKARQVPLIALTSAFVFIIMMFNIPAPGGTSGHMVGGAVAAIILGPWAAVIAVSIALVMQALIFGDGGITAIGANCFNMAFIMPFSGYYTYKFIKGSALPLSKRGAAAACIAGYISLNLAALATAFELGMQPMLAHSPDGRPLYAPYPLSVTIPVMAVEHLFLFGIVEAIGTGLIVSYICKMEQGFLYARENEKFKPLWAILLFILLLTPLGLIAAGSAWGEWGSDKLNVMLGYVPEGLKNMENIWGAVLPGYNISGWEKSPIKTIAGYIISAALGSTVIVGIIYITQNFLKR